MKKKETPKEEKAVTEPVTEPVAKTVEALRNGGYKTILVAKKDSETGDEHSDQ